MWKRLPFTKNFGGNAIYPNIYLREDIYDDLLKNHPHPRSIAVLKHEEFHRKRQKEMGLVRFVLRNYFLPHARLEEELQAYEISMREWKGAGLKFPIDLVARNLSGWMYLWTTSYKEAKARLEEMWRKI